MKKRLMSGMRPTGKLHIGHYLGVLKNWEQLQNEYECFYSVADFHALTTGYDKTKEIPENIREMILDWLSCGINPDKSAVYIQSQIPQIAELHLLLSMITPTTWLERIPSYREAEKKDTGYGFLGYPLLQTADILVVKGEVVPVGQDQLPHLELAREIVRRFHFIFKKEIFPEPESLLSEAPFVPGIDGKKMSKSYNNGIYISDPPEEIQKKVTQTVTDPQKIHKGDPGRPEVCNIFFYHRFFSSQSLVSDIEKNCKNGSLGCVECKKNLSDSLISKLAPVRETRKELSKDSNIISKILKDGAEKTQEISQKTLEETKKLLDLK
jgi:tryptophanyl-tRNA synthetase